MNLHIFNSRQSLFPWRIFQEIMVDTRVIEPQLEDNAIDVRQVDWTVYGEDPSKLIFLFALDNGLPLGFTMLQQRGQILAEIHVVFLPQARGKLALHCIHYTLEQAFAWRGMLKVRAEIPACNRPARVVAARAGLVLEGRSTKSFLKDGELHDILLYGVTKDGYALRKFTPNQDGSHTLH